MKSQAFSQLLHIPVSTLHYYESVGLLIPKRSTSGYRDYQESDLAVMKLILFLKEMNFSLADIQTCLNHFHHLTNRQNLEKCEDALLFFERKKQAFTAQIEIYQLALQIIDTLFADQTLNCHNKTKLMADSQQFIEQFWHLKRHNIPVTSQNLFS